MDGSVVIDDETLTTPYRVEDGSMLLIAGTVDPAAASAALAGVAMAPVPTTTGRALAAVWVADFRQANLGPHGELQFSVFATREEEPAVSPGPWGFYEALSRPMPPLMVCHRLWNTTRRVARYNDVHLGLDALPAAGGLTDGRRWRFAFDDTQGRALARGDVGIPTRTAMAEGAALTRALGLRRALRLADSRSTSLTVVSPRRDRDGRLQLSSTFTQARRSVLRRWTDEDELELLDPHLGALGFAPEVIAAFTGLAFVYLRPEPGAGVHTG